MQHNTPRERQEEHMDISIKGINKAKLLAALHNGTRPLGIGILHARGDLTEQEAAAVIEEHTHGPGVVWFDFVYGRPIKVGFDGDTLIRADLYDRDAPGGVGSAKRIVDSLMG